MDSLILGRPIRLELESYFLAISRRCHAKRVCGVTMAAISFNFPNRIFFAFPASRPALVVGKPRPLGSKMLFEDADFFHQVFDDVLLVLVHPASQANE